MKRNKPVNRNSLSLRRYKPVSEYLRLKDFKENRLWHLLGGKLLTKVGKEYLSESEFDERYMRAIPTTFTSNPLNVNRLKNYSL